MAARGSLAQRISVLAVAVAVITAAVAGVLSVNLTRTVSESSARHTLAQLADAAALTADQGRTARLGQLRARRTLQALRVYIAGVNQSGALAGGDGLAKTALSDDERRRLLTAQSVSLRRDDQGIAVFIEARGTSKGGIVLVQRRSDALAVADRSIRRTLLALLIAAAVAVLLGLLVAYRIARPLRRTAEAAHALAAGERDVQVDVQGPAEVAEVGAAVNTLARALSRSEERQREFLLSVSHDLRTPLTAITGYAESLAEDVVPPEQTAHVGEVMLAESRRLDRMVADLLDLARLDAQNFRIDLAPADLAEVARAAASVWGSRCSAADVIFGIDVPDRPAMVVTDAARVRQVLDGLLENALRVTPAGAPVVLAVRALPGGPGRGGVLVEIRDGGPGLTDADLGVAFQQSVLYERYRGVRKVGTGLGLAIVERLVARLGATVEAGHAEEGGARFTVRLPDAPPGGAGAGSADGAIGAIGAGR